MSLSPVNRNTGIIFDMKSELEELIKRGQASEEHLAPCHDKSSSELLELLKSREPVDRTVAAKLLVKFPEPEVISRLIQILRSEDKLYTRIAITETLGELGEAALPELVKYLGKIGNNQHRELPAKPFEKPNYPLPRDIVARTITKIGVPALTALRKVLESGRQEQVLEALDALGHIAFYEKDRKSFSQVVACLDRFPNDVLVHWKVYRALQSFPNQEAIAILEYVVNNDERRELVWEAERSLRQIHNNGN